MRFPFLAKLSCKSVIIPTSAPAERDFSVAGITIVNDQARLLPENVNKLLFLCEALLSIGRYKESILSYNRLHVFCFWRLPAEVMLLHQIYGM
jgi:hypothetical protein